jgi:hypothetical protein
MDSEKILSKLKDWEHRVIAYQKAHSNKAESQMRWHYYVGLPTIILSTITASTIFANIQNNVDENTKLALACVCLTSAVLSAIQTFYSHAKRAEHNKAIAAELSAARREIDYFEMFPPKTEKEAKERIERINNKLNKIAKDAPVIIVNDTSNDNGNGPSIIMFSRL